MIIGSAVLIIAYILGAIPFGYIMVKRAHGTDIRSVGSGNIGATNVYRKSRGAGIVTLILDGAKGYVAVLVAAWLTDDIRWQAMAAVVAILGHMFTVFLSFKGGKGVATACGAYLALSPQAVGLNAGDLHRGRRTHPIRLIGIGRGRDGVPVTGLSLG